MFCAYNERLHFAVASLLLGLHWDCCLEHSPNRCHAYLPSGLCPASQPPGDERGNNEAADGGEMPDIDSNLNRLKAAKQDR